jgi:uncharacterized membrane protein (UPF0127 family)
VLIIAQRQRRRIAVVVGNRPEVPAFVPTIGGALDLLTVGGVSNGEDAQAVLSRGAKAVPIGSALTKEGPGVVSPYPTGADRRTGPRTRPAHEGEDVGRELSYEAMRRFPWMLASALLCLVYLSLVPSHAADQTRTRVEVVRPGTGVVLLSVDAELATTVEARMRGLMERASLPADQGMLFIFEAAQPLSFWMFNTLIPLDIIFADAERRITSIYAAVPPCRPPLRCPTYTSHGLAQFVLEVNAGTAAKAAIGIGDELRWKLP